MQARVLHSSLCVSMGASSLSRFKTHPRERTSVTFEHGGFQGHAKERARMVVLTRQSKTMLDLLSL